MYSREHRTAKKRPNQAQTPINNQLLPNQLIYQPKIEETTSQTNPITDIQAKTDDETYDNSGRIDGAVFSRQVERPKPRGIQMKLSIGQPGDKYEQEADQVAAKVVQRMNSSESVQRDEVPEEEEQVQAKSLSDTIQREELPEDEEKVQAKSLSDTIQREELPEDEEKVQAKSLSDTIQREEAPEEEEKVQAKSLSDTIQREELPEDEEKVQAKLMVQRRSQEDAQDATPNLEESIQQQRGGGQALAPDVRKSMERGFGTDFSGVKVHTDSKSDEMNKSIQARAFTTGQDVFFKGGEYNPNSKNGQELIAHELTHVVQQKGDKVKE